MKHPRGEHRAPPRRSSFASLVLFAALVAIVGYVAFHFGLFDHLPH